QDRRRNHGAVCQIARSREYDRARDARGRHRGLRASHHLGAGRAGREGRSPSGLTVRPRPRPHSVLIVGVRPTGALVTDQIDPQSGPARLYTNLLDAWNRRDAAGMAALFTHDGSMVGFDGSQIDGGPQPAQAHLAPIFASHATPAYVG